MDEISLVQNLRVPDKWSSPKDARWKCMASMLACETSRIWPKLFSKIFEERNISIYIKEKEKRRRDESSDFPKVIRGERSQLRRGPNTGRYRNDRFRCSGNCYSYAWTSPQPKFPNRFWTSSVRFRAGVSNFIRPLNSRPTWL